MNDVCKLTVCKPQIFGNISLRKMFENVSIVKKKC